MGRLVHQGRDAGVPDTAPAAPQVEGFVFSACQFPALDEDLAQRPETALGLSVHGRVRYLPEPGAPCGERFEIRFGVDGALVLPATSSHGHDVHLWTHAPGFTGRTEVWLHQAHFDPAQCGTPGRGGVG
ncbi:hypothetical protein OKJ48_20845 [Streptomyces kunmingensis]|uniref:Uncharacterized protein n=1 Tax=Streptomyces kunmingensis TaxID=68225 RepID=A0ABU6CD94_9ACTN|nr:hypothetical protein [Streptomyces kunmingensis]MEB3962677.1 hypothetical protein [Streptomyces kunmingensis]